MIAGTLVSGLGLGTASVLTYERGAPAPQPGSVEVPAGSGFSQSLEDTTAALPSPEASPEAGAAPDVSAPEPDDLSALQDGDTETAAQPEAGQAESALAQPAEGAGGSGVEVETEAPVLPSPQAAAPEAPAGEDDLSISTDPAQPALSQAVEESSAFPEESEAPEPESEVEVDPQTDTAATEPESSENNAAPEPAEPEEPAASVAAQDSPATEPAAEPVTEPTQPETPEVAAAPATETAEAPSTEEPEALPAPVTEEAALAEPEAENSSTIGDLAPEVKTNRLPSVGDAEEAAQPEEAETAPESTEASEPEEDTRPPLERFAVPFDNPDNKPLMSIILLDDGTSPVGLEALQNFPYPLSFAVDAGWDGAEDAMVKYRAAGFEVLVLTDLPETAGAKDAEQAMQAIFAALPEVVAVMEGTGSGLQSSRAAAEQLAPILRSSGHGAVLFPKGLNTAQKLLAREGVPSAAVFRDFDAKGQNATVIRRFLDQAAFKAGQEEGGVVMVGRLRPDTVSALLLWGLQDRANSVALAPISALLGSTVQ
ncbi:divergent polysaccharide deacetylase family protein [Roseovarius faecimaris]|uniref:Divergent polysaccharide deacetylase family protein n=1 Tax=Roseovarius faecimaris TaxID=2494550 RepID=A0A6I6IY17_9RHOB|nr:divergent polysaccharide deacetylase family protein [Roseovarius faecimaris]